MRFSAKFKICQEATGCFYAILLCSETFVICLLKKLISNKCLNLNKGVKRANVNPFTVEEIVAL